jgi:cation-transporting ATPase E
VIISALVVGIFPLAVRNSSVITLLTVGIPSIFLALWARPGTQQRTNLARDLWHFVLPAAIFSSLLGLLVFYGTLELRLWSLGLLGGAPDSPALEQATIANTPYAQTALSDFLVFCGLFLVIFVEPPTTWWAGNEAVTGEWKPTLLAVGLMLAFLIISATPLRKLADLSPLEGHDLPLIAAALVVWLVLMRLFWRGRLLERFLGVATD